MVETVGTVILSFWRSCARASALARDATTTINIAIDWAIDIAIDIPIDLAGTAVRERIVHSSITTAPAAMQMLCPNRTHRKRPIAWSRSARCSCCGAFVPLVRGAGKIAREAGARDAHLAGRRRRVAAAADEARLAAGDHGADRRCR